MNTCENKYDYLFDFQLCPISGFDISTCPLAPASEFLKKGLSGKNVLVCTCPNRQTDFLSTTHSSIYRKMAQIPRNMLTMQQNRKENGFKVIKSKRNNTCHSSYVITYFGQAKTFVGQVKIITYLPGKLVLKLMLVPESKCTYLYTAMWP